MPLVDPNVLRPQAIQEIEKQQELSDIWQAEMDEPQSEDSGYYQPDDYLDLTDPVYEEAACKIQRQVRVMIARNNFRVSLYKLILLKNILDTKLHKEKMQMLFAFEQLIINTEDPNEVTDGHS